MTTAYPLRIRKSKDLIAVLAVTFLTLGIGAAAVGLIGREGEIFP